MKSVLLISKEPFLFIIMRCESEKLFSWCFSNIPCEKKVIIKRLFCEKFDWISAVCLSSYQKWLSYSLLTSQSATFFSQGTNINSHMIFQYISVQIKFIYLRHFQLQKNKNKSYTRKSDFFWDRTINGVLIPWYH